MGVWIEINDETIHIGRSTSLPLWECGLKSVKFLIPFASAVVTPLVGVWIEIADESLADHIGEGHSPCGSVD